MSPHVSVGNESVPEAEAGAYHSDVDLTTSGSALGPNTTDVTNPSCHTHFVNGTCDVKTLLSVIADTLDFYFPPILFVAGIICNALVVMVMQSRHFRHISTSFYMSITAGVDFASLLVSLPAHYLYVNFPEVFDNVRQAHIMCSFFNLFGWGSSDMGLLLTVAMTTERSLAIKFPLKATVLCSVRRAKIVSGGLFALEFLKVGHLLFTSRVATKEVTAYLCDVDLSDPSYRIFYTEYWPYIHNIFLFICFVVIIIGNIIITIHVRRSEDGDMGSAGQKTIQNQARMNSKNRQLLIMLIIDSAAIVVCLLPFAVYVVLDEAFQLFDDTPKGHGQGELTFTVTFYLLYVNRCANFFLYCISGSRFRVALKEILSPAWDKKTKELGVPHKRHQVTSSTGTVFMGETEADRVSLSTIGGKHSYTMNVVG